jgi:chaperonin GroES
MYAPPLALHLHCSVQGYVRVAATDTVRISSPKDITGQRRDEGLKTKVKPLGGRVLVKRLEETEKSKGGIIIPDSAKEKPKEGEVVALGTGKLDKDGKKVAFNVKAGDRVLFTSYAGTEVTVDDHEYLIMSEEDILGVVG